MLTRRRVIAGLGALALLEWELLKDKKPIADFAEFFSSLDIPERFYLTDKNRTEGVRIGSSKRGYQPNIILFVSDTQRADYTDPDYMPNLTSLIENGKARNFRSTYAPSDWTKTSTTGLLTGVDPQRLVVGPRDLWERVGRRGLIGNSSRHLEGIHLAEVLKREGYRTGFVSCNPLAGFVQPKGFLDEYIFIKKMANAFEDVDSAIGFIERNEGTEPFYLHLQVMDCHFPRFTGYNVGDSPELEDIMKETFSGKDFIRDLIDGDDLKKVPKDLIKQAERAQRLLYESCVRRVDEAFGNLVDYIERKGLDNTIFLFTSDHGEELGLSDLQFERDHYLAHDGIYACSHGLHLHRSQVHVPLIAVGNGFSGNDTKLRSLLDIVPTIYDMLGIPYEGLDGQPLSSEGHESLMVSGNIWGLPKGGVVFSDGKINQMLPFDPQGEHLKDILRNRSPRGFNPPYLTMTTQEVDGRLRDTTRNEVYSILDHVQRWPYSPLISALSAAEKNNPV